MTFPSRVLLAEESATLPLASLVTAQIYVAQPTSEEDAEARHKAEIEAASANAYEEGRQDGLSEARDAMTVARAELLASCAARLGSAAATLASNRQAILDEVLHDAVDLAFSLLSELVGAELMLRPEATKEAVLRALALAPPEEDLVVRVHPDSQLGAEEFVHLVPADRITVRLDPAVEPDGAIVEAGATRIDAQIGPALARVRSVLSQLTAPSCGSK